MPKLLEKVEHDYNTGICVAEDVRGNLHLLDWSSSVNVGEMPRIYLQSDLKGFTWASSSMYNRIPDSLHPGNFLVYTVPQDYIFNLSFIISAACQRSGSGSITQIGIYVNGEFKIPIPFFREIAYKPYAPLSYPAGTVIELVCKPGTKDTDFGITSGGYLIRKA